MHEKYHMLSAVPFLAIGEYSIALGCVLPDVTWIHNEVAFRRSSTANWHEWIKTRKSIHILPYRIAHSVVLWCLLGSLTGWWGLVIGCIIHIALDLPTHTGIMRQEPLYPIRWRWPWTVER